MHDTPALIRALQDPAAYAHRVKRVELIETHISWVLLTGEYAYKIKKPVDLGFLDFSSLDKRHQALRDELRLNRRLAPELYLEIVPICGSHDQPRLGGDGQPFEFALRMVQFPTAARLDQVLERGALTPEMLEELSVELARFHASLEPATPDSPWANPDRATLPVMQTMAELRRRQDQFTDAALLDRLDEWFQDEFAARRESFARRSRSGLVRECHGDLHLGNLVLLHGRVTMFDGLEFNASLRWIDVISDVAFLVMDLWFRARTDLAQRVLNAYLAQTGDYGSLEVLPYYFAYRALVRAEVACIRRQQPDLPAQEQSALVAQQQSYLRLVAARLGGTPPRLWITHGLSGSGKSTLAKALADAAGVIRARSDVERKRPMVRGDSDGTVMPNQEERYSRSAIDAVYARLMRIARTVLSAGFTCLLDATFLRRQQRDQARRLAAEMGVPCTILDLRASTDVLRQRVAARAKLGSDASDATLDVLTDQLATREPLGADEMPWVLVVNAEAPWDPHDILSRLDAGS